MREGDGMPGAKAPRNKTIDTPLSAGGAYLERCVTVERPLDSIEELCLLCILLEQHELVAGCLNFCFDTVHGSCCERLFCCN